MKSKEKNNGFLLDVIILGLILITAFLLRAYQMNAPITDFESWKQSDTAAIARNFIQDGFNLIHPHYADDRPNAVGLHSFEFPLYSATTGALTKYLPLLPLEVYGRLITILSSLLLISVIYVFLMKYVGRLAAIVGATMYAIFPFFVFFSRVILPEPLSVSLTFTGLLLGFFYSEEKASWKEWIYFFSSAIFLSLGILISPYSAVYIIAALALLAKKFKWGLPQKAQLYVYLGIALFPMIAWQSWIGTMHQSFLDYLVNSNVYTGSGHRDFLNPQFFHVVLYERLTTSILGGIVAFFFLLGLLSKTKKTFFISLLSSAISFLFLFQTFAVYHVHFLVFVLPVIAIYTALGVDYLQKHNRTFISPVLLTILGILFFSFSFVISYEQVKPYYSYSNDTLVIANILRDLTQKGDKIVIDTGGDVTLLYLSGREGTANLNQDFSTMKKDGYTYYVSVNPRQTDKLANDETHTLIFESDKVAIFKL